ncbi:MAG: hypothetical protein ACLQU3_25225 [Limisphaerales bacterium]
MVTPDLARKKFNEGHITDPLFGVVELSQLALWQQQPPEGGGIRFQRQLEHREGQFADLTVQESGFGHDYVEVAPGADPASAGHRFFRLGGCQDGFNPWRI